MNAADLDALIAKLRVIANQMAMVYLNVHAADDLNEAAAALAVLRADAVPREPTPAMIQAWRRLHPVTTSSYVIVETWQAMYDAAREAKP